MCHTTFTTIDLPNFSSLQTEALCLLNKIKKVPFFPLPNLSNHLSVLCLYKFYCFRYSVLVESCTICHFVTSLFHLFYLMPSSFLYGVQCVRIPSFLKLVDIPLYESATCFSSIHTLTDSGLLPPFPYCRLL